MKLTTRLILIIGVALFAACLLIPAQATEVVVLKDTFVTGTTNADINFERNSRQSGTYFDANGPWGYNEWIYPENSSVSSAGLVEAGETWCCAFGTVDVMPYIESDEFDVSVTVTVDQINACRPCLFLKPTAAAQPADGAYVLQIWNTDGNYCVGTNWGGDPNEWFINPVATHAGPYNLRIHVDNSGSKAVMYAYVDGKLVNQSTSQVKWTTAYAGVGILGMSPLAKAEFKDLKVSYESAEVVVMQDTFATSAPSGDPNFERELGRQSGTYYDANGPWGYFEWPDSITSNLTGTGLSECGGYGVWGCAFGAVDLLPYIDSDEFDVSVTVVPDEVNKGRGQLVLKSSTLTGIAEGGSYVLQLWNLDGKFCVGTNWGGEPNEWFVDTVATHTGPYNLRVHVDNSGNTAVMSAYVDGILVNQSTSQAKWTKLYAGVGMYSEVPEATSEFRNLKVSYQQKPAVVVLKDTFATSAASSDLNFERGLGRQSGTYFDANGPWGYFEWADAISSNLTGTGLSECGGDLVWGCAFGTVDVLPYIEGDEFDVSVTVIPDDVENGRGQLVLKPSTGTGITDGSYVLQLWNLDGQYCVGTNWGGDPNEWFIGAVTAHAGPYNLRIHVDNSGSTAVMSAYVDGKLVNQSTSQAKWTNLYAGCGIYSIDPESTAEFRDLTVSYQQDAPLPTITYSDDTVLDGNLDDWNNADWKVADAKYFSGNWANNDMSEAEIAYRWGAGGTKLYLAAKVKDTHHILTDSYADWNFSDRIEMFVYNNGTQGQYFTGAIPGGEEIAQQYTVGLATNKVDVWSAMGYNQATPASAGLRVAIKEVGQYYYYEAEITPFEYFGGLVNQPNVLALLEAGDTVGLDCTIDSSDVVNTDPSAVEHWHNLGLDLLAGKNAKIESIMKHTLVRTGVQGKITLTGYVGSTLGATARIVIKDANNVSETHDLVLDGSGTYSFITALSGDCTATASAPGYASQTKSVTVTDGQGSVDFTLTEATAEAVSVSDAKKKAIDSLVIVTGSITAVFNGSIYIETTDRSSGIRVDKASHGLTSASIDKVASVTGSVKKDPATGEIYIDANLIDVTTQTSEIKPLGLTNRSAGGGDALDGEGDGQVGVDQGAGLNNIGLLVRTTGVASGGDASGFIITDGSGVTLQVSLAGAGTAYNGKHVTVTGISSIGAGGVRVIKARSTGDVQPVN